MAIDENDLPDKAEAGEFYAKYEPREVLGRGLVSVVRKCVEKATGVEYAVKIIDIASEEGLKILDETRKEIQILKMMTDCSNVVCLHDWQETESFIFLVLELCTQGELFDYMTRVVTVSVKQTRVIMQKLLSVVKLMHQRDIVHRDIKPENILLDENMNLKVSDFGFATFVSDDYELKELMGTPAYLSPEVLKGAMGTATQGYGRPTDIWACGVVMYTLLVGQPPFWHRRQMMMLRMIMEGRYSLTTPEWEDVPETAKDLIRRMLTVDPDSRISATDALAHEFFLTFNPEHLQVPGFSATTEMKPCSTFNPRAKLRCAMIIVLCVTRLRMQMLVSTRPVGPDVMSRNPYGVKAVRKVIDSCAFRVYGHWVKKGDQQNRAALFENTCKVTNIPIFI